MEKIKVPLKPGDKKGNTKKLEEAMLKMSQRKPKLLALHYMPKVVRENFEEILKTLIEDKAPKEMVDLYTDAVVLLRRAEQEFRVVKPPKEVTNEKVS